MKIEDAIMLTKELTEPPYEIDNDDYLDTVISALEKQIPKLPEHKVHEKYPTLGRNYYCTCGVMFVDWENNPTNYCGNCGQRLK